MPVRRLVESTGSGSMAKVGFAGVGIERDEKQAKSVGHTGTISMMRLEARNTSSRMMLRFPRLQPFQKFPRSPLEFGQNALSEEYT
jgi:hypothetical protein